VVLPPAPPVWEEKDGAWRRGHRLGWLQFDSPITQPGSRPHCKRGWMLRAEGYTVDIWFWCELDWSAMEETSSHLHWDVEDISHFFHEVALSSASRRESLSWLSRCSWSWCSERTTGRAQTQPKQMVLQAVDTHSHMDMDTFFIMWLSVVYSKFLNLAVGFSWWVFSFNLIGWFVQFIWVKWMSRYSNTYCNIIQVQFVSVQTLLSTYINYFKLTYCKQTWINNEKILYL